MKHVYDEAEQLRLEYSYKLWATTTAFVFCFLVGVAMRLYDRKLESKAEQELNLPENADVLLQ